MVYNNCLIEKSMFLMKVKVHVNLTIFGFDQLVIEGPLISCNWNVYF